MSNKKMPHTEAALIEIFRKDNIDEQYFQKFIAYYKYCFAELFEDYKDYSDEDFDEGDSVQAMAIRCTNLFIKPYLELIGRGHGEEWAYSFSDCVEDGESAIYFTYNNVKSIDPDMAKKELLIHTKSLGGDAYFQNHYIHLFEVQANPTGRIEAAQKYSRLYKEQLAKGKSELFAHQYAGLMADGAYHQIYCEDYAFAYEDALLQKRSEEFASIYANKYASALVNIKRRHGISDDERMIGFAIEKVKAYMNAWQYAKKNQIKDFEQFASIYENVHLNTYFADEGVPFTNLEEVDKMVLIEVLKRFNK